MEQFETYGAEHEPVTLVAEAEADAGEQPVMSKADWKQRTRPAKREMFRRKLPLEAGLFFYTMYQAKMNFGNFWLNVILYPFVLVILYFLHKRIDRIASEKFDFECPLCGAGITPTGSYARGFTWHNLNQDGKCPKCRGKIIDIDNTVSITTNVIAIGLIVVMIAAFAWYFIFRS